MKAVASTVIVLVIVMMAAAVAASPLLSSSGIDLSSLTGGTSLSDLTGLRCRNVVTNGNFETGNLDGWVANSPTINVTTRNVYAGEYSADVNNGNLQQFNIPLSSCGGYPSTFSFAVYLKANTIPAVQIITYPNATGPASPIFYLIYNPESHNSSVIARNFCKPDILSYICIPEAQSEEWYHITRNLASDLAAQGYPQGPYVSAYIGLTSIGIEGNDLGNLGTDVLYDNIALKVSSSPGLPYPG